MSTSNAVALDLPKDSALRNSLLSFKTWFEEAIDELLGTIRLLLGSASFLKLYIHFFFVRILAPRAIKLLGSDSLYLYIYIHIICTYIYIYKYIPGIC